MHIVNLPEAPEAHSLHCLDRLVISGTAVGLHHASAMKYFLMDMGVPKSDFTKWAQTIRDQMKAHVHALAARHGIRVIPWKEKLGRKDDLAKKLIAERGEFGPIVIIESFEKCRTYYYAKSRDDDRDFYASSSKCIHYYIYINDPILGLVHIRIQSYAPFPIQVILNGHRILERLLIQKKMKHTAVDNAIIACADIMGAQKISDDIDDLFLKEHIRRLTRLYCPYMNFLPAGYRLTIRQIEYSTDILFTEDPDIYRRYADIIPRLLQQSPHEVLRFIQCDGTTSRKMVESRAYQTRFGSCIKFTLGNVNIKTYTKHDRVLRIETTCRDMTSLRALRTVYHKDRTRSIQRKPLTKSIHDLQLFINYAKRANMRFLETISHAMTTNHDNRHLHHVVTDKRINGRAMKGFNYFDERDQQCMQAIAHPKLDLLPFSRKTFAELAGGITAYQASHILRRLRSHGMIKKLPRSRLYYPTEIGKKACATALYMNREVIVPIMAA